LKKEVVLSPQQQEIIDYAGSQLLIRGIAGSGKTLILLRKARDVAEKNPNETVAIFSFGNALMKSAQKQLEEYKLPNLKVMTFHSWAMQNYFKTFRKKFYLEYNSNKFLSEALKELSSKYPNHRFFTNKDLFSFISEEISWIKGAYLTSMEQYEKAPRKGRGGKIRLSKNDRKILFEIYEKYEEIKDYRHDYDDFALDYYKNLNKIKDDSKFDHIFIDEAQDLTKVSLTVLTNIARKSCIVGADLGQKIYATSFTWEQVGLNIKGGRTKVLTNSYRSTKQIINLAYSLQKNDAISEDKEFTKPDLPNEEGPIPKIYVTSDEKTQDIAIVNLAKKLVESNPDTTIGILCRNWDIVYRLRRVFINEKLDYKLIKNENNKSNSHEIGSHHEPGIKFTTFHTAKGLEFHYVVIPEVVNPPLETKLGDEFDWDIERRLLYVAMTRAMVHLQIFTYGNKHKLIDELDNNYYEEIPLLEQ